MSAVEMAAHAEWHANTGQRYGCPWDACEPPEPERCPECAEYLYGDTPCSNAEQDWHIAAHASRLGMQLQARAEQMQRERREAELDPW